MKSALVEFLAEPETNAPLELVDAVRQGDEIVSGLLRSVQTGRTFPIVEGIPRFVESANYARSFGMQWNRFAQTQLDSANGADYSTQRFLAETRWTRETLDNKWVFDGGCGSGRFAEVAASMGAHVIALDYSSAIDAAAKNLSRYPNVHCVQGNLLQPPIRRRRLDFAYSIGVLQHTPDSSRALAALIHLVREGGELAVVAYAKRWYTPLYGKYLVRPFTKRVSPEALLSAITLSMPILFPITDVLFRIPVLGKAFQFMIPVANYVDKSKFTRAQRYQEAILDTLDMLSPAYDDPLTAEGVDEVFVAERVSKVNFLHRVPINVVATI